MFFEPEFWQGVKDAHWAGRQLPVDAVGAVNGLSAAEAERLALLVEECGEVIQAVGKILRHGYATVNPTIPGGRTNLEQLQVELGDWVNAVDLMVAAGDLDADAVLDRTVWKASRVELHWHCQREKVKLG